MTPRSRKRAPGPDTRKEATGPGQSHVRLEHLYEISKLFASFENVEQTFDPAVGIIARTLPLRSAMLIETYDGRPRMFIWPSEGRDAEHMRAVKEHVEAAYKYLIGAAADDSVEPTEQAGMTPLPPQPEAGGEGANRFIVLPLVVARQPPFGALQLEGARILDKADLTFVNAIANQLAIALDRHRAWRRDIIRREHAEEGRTHAEAKGARAERERGIAQSLSEKYEALAGENASLYQKAQHALRGRERMLAIVSHDLKNPLGAILMTTDSLAKKGVEERRHGLPQAVARIQRSAERMLRLIEDLLDFASIEAGRLAIKRQPEDPASIVQETLASFESVAQEKRLRLTANVEPHLPKAYCDRDRILQVLSNLVGNATKVTAAGGHITVRVEAQEHELLFAVSDDGPGISEEDAKHLFEHYWRSDDAEYKGTGLGLAIAKGIVRAHGGRIWVDSEPGRGAAFLFTVHAADAADIRAGEGASQSHHPRR
jgi:signal transduction histidine kinase